MADFSESSSLIPVSTHDHAQQSLPLQFSIESFQNSTLCHATVTIPAAFVDMIYHEAALSQQKSVHTSGFNRGEVPLPYIKEHLKENLAEHLKEFFLHYCVINFLHEKMREQKLMVAGDPRLKDIFLTPNHDALFRFEFTLFSELAMYEWRYLPFKAPKRKNYKDLDRQVEAFVKEEKEKCELYTNNNTIQTGDVVNFTIEITSHDGIPLLSGLKQNFWFRLGEEEIESPLREIFLHKKTGERFSTSNKDLQAFFSNQFETNYNFCIEIVDTLPYVFFCFEQFKKQFRLKTNKEMHQKLIEVFSYRNDISQRHAMVEEALKLLLSKHRFPVPNHLVLRHQKILIESMQQNPDYHVYRIQKDFQARIRQLAEKQVREAIFIDQLAYHENIPISETDIKWYYNLTNRQRMKEFIYFALPSFKIQGQEVPVASETIKRFALREKTINFVIYHLIKN